MTRGAGVGLFVVRIVLGIIFVVHGSQKVFGAFGGPGLEGTVGFMGSLGLPSFLGYVLAFTEFIGGILLIVGLFSRTAALGLAIAMVVAILKVHAPNGFFNMDPRNPGQIGWEFNLALIGMSLGILFGGPGAFAIADPEPRLFAGGGERHPRGTPHPVS